MESLPSLSLILPNYNHARFLPRALDAIFTQTVQPAEVIAVDDGSTDESVAILRAYAQRQPHLRIVAHPTNRGIFPNLVEAVHEARGDYVATPAADDHLAPGYLERALRLAARHPQAGVVVGKVMLIDDLGRVRRQMAPRAWREDQYVSPGEFLTNCLWREEACFSLGPTAVFRTELLREMVEVMEQAGPFADGFCVQAVGLKTGLCYTPQPGAYFRLSEQSISGQISAERVTQVAKAVGNLMRSERFRSLFPEEFVRYWETDYVRWGRKHERRARMARRFPLLGRLIAAARSLRERCLAIFGRGA